MPLTATLRKVPTWGWLVVGGATLGIGYRFYQDRRTADALPPSAGEADALAGADGYMVSETPSPAFAQPPTIIDPGGGTSEVGAIGQTATETVIGGITGIFEGLPALLEAVKPDPVDPPVIQVNVPASPAPGSGSNRGPAQPAAPKHAGVTILGKHFPHAVGYSEIPTPKQDSRDFNIRFNNPPRTQRWRRAKNGTWRKLT